MEESTLASIAATLLLVSFALLSAIAAAGIVLTLKIARRRRAQQYPAGPAFDGAVPVTPLSAAQAERWSRHYAIAVIVGGATAAALVVASIALG